MDRDTRPRLWRAMRIASLAGPAAFFAITIAEAIVWCGWLGMKCNDVAILFLPVFGLVVGLPIAYGIGLLLMPLALRLAGSHRLTGGVVLLLAGAVTILFGGVAVPLALAGNTTGAPESWLPGVAAVGAWGIVTAGPPIFVSALVFYRLATPRVGPGARPPGRLARWFNARVLVVAVGGPLVALWTWVQIYEPAKPGARIYFHTRPGVRLIWESAPDEPKDLLSRLDEAGFPTAGFEAQRHGREMGRGYVSLVRWRDRPAVRDRVVTWLRAQPEVMSVWIDSTTNGRDGMRR